MTDTADNTDMNEAAIKKVAQVHQLMAESVSKIIAEHQIHPLVTVQVMVIEAATLAWCSLIESGATNDNIREFWSTLTSEVSKRELSEESLTRARGKLDQILAAQPAEA